MLDRDLAELYEVETRVLNQAVKRNLERFPEKFCFNLTKNEIEILRLDILTNWTSQNVISNFKMSLRKSPSVFTEHGVIMLASLLKSQIAIEVSIKIIDAFVEMRKFLSQNNTFLQKFQQIDQKLIEHDENFNKIFKAIEKPLKPKYGIFFENQVYDAYQFITDLIKQAKEEIILIDNYIDESVLTIFSKTIVKTTIYTKEITKQLELDLKKYNEQYDNLEIKEFKLSHDRFLIIDNQTYHSGASLKDLGKRWFAFSKINITEDILKKLH